jgi:hypothetical protein
MAHDQHEPAVAHVLHERRLGAAAARQRDDEKSVE